MAQLELSTGVPTQPTQPTLSHHYILISPTVVYCTQSYESEQEDVKQKMKDVTLAVARHLHEHESSLESLERAFFESMEKKCELVDDLCLKFRDMDLKFKELIVCAHCGRPPHGITYIYNMHVVCII
jgi:hypothetical protein